MGSPFTILRLPDPENSQVVYLEDLRGADYMSTGDLPSIERCGLVLSSGTVVRSTPSSRSSSTQFRCPRASRDGLKPLIRPGRLPTGGCSRSTRDHRSRGVPALQMHPRGRPAAVVAAQNRMPSPS